MLNRREKKEKGERGRGSERSRNGWWGVGCLFVSFFPHSCSVTNPASSPDLTHSVFCLFLAPGEVCEVASEGQSGAHVPSWSAPSRDSPRLYFTVPHSACWLWVLHSSDDWLWVLEHSHGSLSDRQLFRGINVGSRGYSLTISSRRFTCFIVSSDIFSGIYIASSSCTLSNVELWVVFLSSRTFTWITVSSITFSRVYTLAISSRRFTLLVLKLSVRFMWIQLLTDLLLLIFEF